MMNYAWSYRFLTIPSPGIRHSLAQHSSDYLGYPKRVQRKSSGEGFLLIDDRRKGILYASPSNQNLDQYRKIQKIEKGNISLSVLYEQKHLRNTVTECNRFSLRFFQIFMCFIDVQEKAKEPRFSQT